MEHRITFNEAVLKLTEDKTQSKMICLPSLICCIVAGFDISI